MNIPHTDIQDRLFSKSLLKILQSEIHYCRRMYNGLIELFLRKLSWIIQSNLPIVSNNSNQ